MVAGGVVALVLAVLASVLPCSKAAENISLTQQHNTLNVFRDADQPTVAVTDGGNKEAAVEVRTARELIDYVRDGFRYIIIRSHLDLTGLEGMDPTSVLVPPKHLALLVRFYPFL